jgi:hypothetical protein
MHLPSLRKSALAISGKTHFLLKKKGLQISVHIESRVTTAHIRCSRQKSQSLIPCSESRMETKSLGK